MSTSPGHARWRRNAVLSLVLVIAVVALGARLARARLNWKLDLTEEQLSRPSAVGARMLRELEDAFEVRAYFTGEVELGVAQLAKRRLVDQLEEVRRLAAGRLALSFRDPNGSSEARAEALALGVVPQTIGALQGTSAVSQDLYLGLVLRYRGREEVLPFVLPQSFEYAFLSAVRRLERGGEPVVGLLTGRGDGADTDFSELRTLLDAGRELRPLVDLDVSGVVPLDVDVVLVAGPRELHPRAVFALDQYVQRGGRLALFVDRSQVDPSSGTIAMLATGLEVLLDAWGAPFSERLAWDTEHANPVMTVETLDVDGRDQPTRRARVAYPAWVGVVPAGLNPDEVVTTRLAGLDLFWAHPLLPLDDSGVPEGVTRTTLVESSARSFAVAPENGVVDLNPAVVQGRTATLLARSEGRALPLAAVLRGRFPSPFVASAPAPFDPVAAALHEQAVATAIETGTDVPAPPAIGTTDEPVASAAADTLVVVVGDTDWTRDGGFLTPRNAMVVEDLVDWLTLEEDLLALRARRPVERPLRDFLGEARAARGLPAMVQGERFSTDDAARLRTEEEAARAAAAARWIWMGAASGGALLLAVLVALCGHFVLGRTRIPGVVDA